MSLDKRSTKSKKSIKNRKVGRWFIGETLGKGGFSWVKKGYDRKDGRVVALKFTSKTNANWTELLSQQIQNEIEALRKLKHPHVLQLLAYNLSAKYPQKDGMVIPSVLLVLEYLPGGELFDILFYTSALPEEIARTYFQQLISGLKACHDAGICHRDIKPQNLLLDASFQLKIADFGLAKLFEPEEENKVMQTFYVGTRGYQAPEILNKQPYKVACDVFSCGVVLFILMAGYPPFESATAKCRWYAPLVARDARSFWKQHRGCGIPGAAKDLITRMLWFDAKKRIRTRGIKKHKWYNGKTLTPKELSAALSDLHRLMEIKRRDDAKKQMDLQNSINTRDIVLETRTARVFDAGESTVRHVAKIARAVLRSDATGQQADCTAQMQKFWDQNKRTIGAKNLVRSIAVEIPDSAQATQIAAQDDAHVEIVYTKNECYPPVFPATEAVTFKDVFTTCMPQMVLNYIQMSVFELGGQADLDIPTAAIQFSLATHNFPDPVVIHAQVYFHQTYSCYLVKFERISGDVLHFSRILRKLIRSCGPVLTGLPEKYF